MRSMTPACTLIFLLMMLCVTITPACGPNKRTKAIQTTYHALVAAQDGFVAWNGPHELELVRKATSRADADKALADYQAKRAVLYESFKVVGDALKLAAVSTDDVTYADAMAKAAQLLQSIRDLMGTINAGGK